MLTSVKGKHPFWHPQTHANPHPVYAQMRAEEPICCVTNPNTGNTMILLTRYDDCVTLLKDSDPRIGKDYNKLPLDVQHETGMIASQNSLAHSILYLDPPNHTRLRNLIHKAFTPRLIRDLREQITTITTELLDEMGERGETDFIAAFANPLPIIVIAELIGLPKEDRLDFRQWTNDLLFSTGADRQAKVNNARDSFIEYFNALIAKRRENPEDDILSALISVEESGDRMNLQELLEMILLLLIAGFETTTNLLGNGLLALLQAPEQMQLFREKLDDCDFVTTAVEELLRYNSPVDATTARFAVEDMEYMGVELKQGNKIHALLVAANRDPEQFENPDTLDLQRSPNKHIAFGSGIHYCLGAPLARLEANIAFPAMLSRFSKFELTVPVEELEWNPSLIVHGMATMPIHYQK